MRIDAEPGGDPAQRPDDRRRRRVAAGEAAAIGAPALWLQLGIRSPEARRIAAVSGMDCVENACTAVVHRLLQG